MTAAPSFAQADKFNTRTVASLDTGERFYHSKDKCLDHTDFILFRNFKDFLEFVPRILFLKIKTPAPKEASRPSQKESLLCEHPPSPPRICEEHLPRPASQRHRQSPSSWNGLTFTFWRRDQKADKEWVAIRGGYLQSTGIELQEAGGKSTEGFLLESSMPSGIRHMAVN